MSELYLPETAVMAFVHESPIKAETNEPVALEFLNQQARNIKSNLEPIESYKVRRSTCMEDRGRLELLNGEPTNNRLALPGGITVYGLNQLVLLDDTHGDTADEIAANADKRLVDSGFLRGAHTGCAAADNVHAIFGIMGNNEAKVRDYMQNQLQDKYQKRMADNVFRLARAAFLSGTFEGFGEKNIVKLYGEEAGEAVEKLIPDLEHGAKTFARIDVPFAAVNVTNIFNNTPPEAGKGSYIINDSYAKSVNSALTSGPHSTEMQLQAEHNHEAIVMATLLAVPSPVLYQIDIHPTR